MCFYTFQQDLAGVWVVVSINTAKMSETQGMLSVYIALGKVEERDNCMDLKCSACSLTTQVCICRAYSCNCTFPRKTLLFEYV